MTEYHFAGLVALYAISIAFAFYVGHYKGFEQGRKFNRKRKDRS